MNSALIEELNCALDRGQYLFVEKYLNTLSKMNFWNPDCDLLKKRLKEVQSRNIKPNHIDTNGLATTEIKLIELTFENWTDETVVFDKLYPEVDYLVAQNRFNQLCHRLKQKNKYSVLRNNSEIMTVRCENEI